MNHAGAQVGSGGGDGKEMHGYDVVKILVKCYQSYNVLMRWRVSELKMPNPVGCISLYILRLAEPTEANTQP
jgi:hypothetical protein